MTMNILIRNVPNRLVVLQEARKRHGFLVSDVALGPNTSISIRRRGITLESLYVVECIGRIVEELK